GDPARLEPELAPGADRRGTVEGAGPGGPGGRDRFPPFLRRLHSRLFLFPGGKARNSPPSQPARGGLAGRSKAGFFPKQRPVGTGEIGVSGVVSRRGFVSEGRGKQAPDAGKAGVSSPGDSPGPEGGDPKDIAPPARPGHRPGDRDGTPPPGDGGAP